jgi:hypothetical protein
MAMRTFVTSCVLAMAGLLVATSAAAQDRPGPSLDVHAAWFGFADDGIVSEAGFGGAFRWYLHKRIAIGPEAIYVQGDNHDHFVLTGNLTVDLLPGRALEPFITVGGGLFQTHESFFDDAVTSSEGAFTAGGGVRARVGDRISVGVDARVGWETHIRVGGMVAIRLGR